VSNTHTTEDLSFLIVPPEEIDDIWLKVKNQIKRTNDTVLNDTDVYNYLKSGEYFLWLITDNKTEEIIIVSTLTLLQYPRNLVCRVVTLAGSRLEEWLLDYLHTIEDWARSNDCSYIEVEGRKGWVKKLTEYKVDYYTLRKKL